MEIEPFLQSLLELLELAICTISGFMLKKYVFLEPDMEEKKQRTFYYITLGAMLISYFAFGYSIAMNGVMLFLIALNIILARKKYRLFGMLMVMIPLIGIVNGLLQPLLIVVPYLFRMSEKELYIYQLMAFGVFFLLMAVFYFKGKSWRSWFKENTQNRKLRRSELCLLWLIGILMVFFSREVYEQTQGGAIAIGEEYGQQLARFIGISSVAGVVMSVAIIVLIAQGNKRSFYHDRILAMQSGMVTLMADMVENRDDNTGGHIKRTANYVECIAKELKRRGAYPTILTDEYVENLIVAAPLHDIGKIHVPDAVLNKPGRLTDDEFDIMKTHTTAGQELLGHAKEELGEYGYLTMAMEMATYHHEWWNGKGYPYGVSGEEIPLCARIMAVADVFDALISKRCYKDPMPLERAYAIIREESGTHFDSEIVEAFFAVTDKIEAIATSV